jgi:hypothetical protein
VDEMPTRPHPELGGHLQLEVGQPARRAKAASRSARWIWYWGKPKAASSAPASGVRS